MRMNLPPNVNRIIHILQENGFEAYAVGGCVRDSILGRVPGDWDITTSASPQEIKSLFSHTVDTGIEHGTVTVLMDREGFEVTTYRVDGDYEDCRHPKSVQFTRNLREDLLRRDFTINAMAYNDEDGLVDIFGGMEDLEKRMIRCVGCARERFGEDALRIMRAVRFAAQLGFEIEEETKEAIRALAGNLRQISAERIQTELVKLMTSPHPELIREAYELGITAVILPEFDRLMDTTQETPHHFCNVGEHTLHVICAVRNDRILRLAALFHDFGKPDMKSIDAEGVAHFTGHGKRSEEMTRVILKRLKFDNYTLRNVCKLVLYHDYHYKTKATPENVRRSMAIIGEELFPYYIELRRADMMGQSEYRRAEKMANLHLVEQYYHETLEKGDCVSLKTLAVTGKDLIEAGIQQGKAVGETLEKLLDAVLSDPEKNTKEELLKLI